jgi:hypothetical protein
MACACGRRGDMCARRRSTKPSQSTTHEYWTLIASTCSLTPCIAYTQYVLSPRPPGSRRMRRQSRLQTGSRVPPSIAIRGTASSLRRCFQVYLTAPTSATSSCCYCSRSTCTSGTVCVHTLMYNTRYVPIGTPLCYCPVAHKWEVVVVDPLSPNLHTEGNFHPVFST